MTKQWILVLLCAVVLASGVEARTLTAAQKKECLKLLQIAEFKDADWIYDSCGFDDEELAWFEWAPAVSAAIYPKAMYELCMRYPKHDYSELYCQKSAAAGYAPAYYALAQAAQKRGEANYYESNLKRVIEVNEIKDKKLLKTQSDFAARQAYEELGRLYLQGGEEAHRAEGLRLMQVAADAGSPTAAHALGVLLSWNPTPEQQGLSEKYLWKAILQGCPAAEENLGIMNYLAEGRIYQEDAREAMEKRLYTCNASKTVSHDVKIMTAQDCACTEVLSWYETQRKKPFMILSIENGVAVLKDPKNQEYSVRKGDKVVDGYVVEDVRSTAVIVRGGGQRYVLLQREDSDCVELCLNPNVIPKRYVDDLPAYHLIFTPDECDKLAKSIENLNNPNDPFRGLPECQLQDWKRWGQSALNEKRNKHLFLLGNYEKSDYIPAQVAQAELFYEKGDERYMPVIGNLLTYATGQEPVDALSTLKKEQAYCIKTKLHMDGKYADGGLAFEWAKAGADLGYPQSMNMLGVAYAKGLGTKADLVKAEEWFLAAEKASDVPFLAARLNYQILKSKQSFDKMSYGVCRDILSAPVVTQKELLNLY